jgi:hypothetical protein
VIFKLEKAAGWGFIGYGLEIVKNLPIQIHPKPHNEKISANKKR